MFDNNHQLLPDRQMTVSEELICRNNGSCNLYLSVESVELGDQLHTTSTLQYNIKRVKCVQYKLFEIERKELTRNASVQQRPH